MASAPRKRLQTTETNEQKRIRMDIRNEKDRARRREWDRAKKRAKSIQEKAARLSVQHQRLENESPEVRASRLDRMSALRHQTLASELPEKRTARLNEMSALQHQRLASESPDKRAGT